MFRVPAPELETLVGSFLRDHCRNQQTDLQSLIEAQVAKITIEADSISVELASPQRHPAVFACTNCESALVEKAVPGCQRRGS